MGQLGLLTPLLWPLSPLLLPLPPFSPFCFVLFSPVQLWASLVWRQEAEEAEGWVWVMFGWAWLLRGPFGGPERGVSVRKILQSAHPAASGPPPHSWRHPPATNGRVSEVMSCTCSWLCLDSCSRQLDELRARAPHSSVPFTRSEIILLGEAPPLPSHQSNLPGLSGAAEGRWAAARDRSRFPGSVWQGPQGETPPSTGWRIRHSAEEKRY